MLTTALLILVLLTLILFAWRNVSFRQGKFGGHLPGPQAWPLIGNLPDLFHTDLPVHLLELAQKYGPIYHLRMGMKGNLVEVPGGRNGLRVTIGSNAAEKAVGTQPFNFFFFHLFFISLSPSLHTPSPKMWWC